MDHLTKAFDPAIFRRTGHALVDQLADYLEQMRQAGPGEPVIRYRTPAKALADWRERLRPGTDPLELFGEVLRQSVALNHPHYMGHQISPPAPVSALAGLLGDFLNNGMGVYEMGMAGTATEQVVVHEVARALGFGEGAGGFLTSGGTLANLTALLTARSVKAPTGVWTEGTTEPLALLVSEEAHYCVDRAARIMGWGEGGIIKVPVDAQFRMRTDALSQYYDQARAAGRTVIAIVGSACSTATGSFDNLNAIADFARAHDLWFHVDGAHGAALAFSPAYRHLVAGLERADSVAMDFHKMLLTPSITTALLYRNVHDSYHTFQQRASYLLEWEADEQWHNLARRTLECTKLMLGLKVYSIMAVHGTALWEEYVTRVCDLGHLLGRLVREQPDLELALEPQCNIVCFRYRPADAAVSPDELNQLNARIRQQLLETGDFYIVQTQLRGHTWLRTTLTNAFTGEEHLRGLLERVRALGEAQVGVRSEE